jgi:glutamate--cysteine ligase
MDNHYPTGVSTLSAIFDNRIRMLAESDSQACLWGGLKGIEKESLRIGQDGLLSTLPQPVALGSALTNRFITTDFSEALLEFVTPTFAHTWEALQFLSDVHQFTYDSLHDELLWITSMPCAMTTDRDIPLAQYGSSNVGRMKTIYRNGLGYRYGRRMQTIAGIHFNYSLPVEFWPLYQQMQQKSGDPDQFRSEAYLGLLRNYRRVAWIVLYLFGASPALCKSFAEDDSLSMRSFDDSTFYEPFATSLRMSDLGYSNNTQAGINISLNSLDEYIADLSAAISTPDPAFAKIGRKTDGEYRQLSVNQLQIENEYYSAIRPKRVARSGERPTAALRRGGIEYVEVRSLDLNVFDPVGISQNTMRFVEALLVFCLLEESAPFGDAEIAEATANHSAVAHSGRDPELRLQRKGKPIGLKSWASEILQKVRQVARLIDRGNDRDDYVQAVAAQAALVNDPALTPSARILQDLGDSGSGFFQYALDAARNNKQYFAALEPLQGDRLRMFVDEAADSVRRQADIEASDNISLDDYLEDYFSA